MSHDLRFVNISSIDEDHGEIKNSFMTMKMKRQNYFGKPAIAIYIQDVTKKLKRRLSHL